MTEHLSHSVDFSAFSSFRSLYHLHINDIFLALDKSQRGDCIGYITGALAAEFLEMQLIVVLQNVVAQFTLRKSKSHVGPHGGGRFFFLGIASIVVFVVAAQNSSVILNALKSGSLDGISKRRH